jgi:hypothetical protein
VDQGREKDWPFLVVKCDVCGAAARYVQPDEGEPFILCTGNSGHNLRIPPGMRTVDQVVAMAKERDGSVVRLELLEVEPRRLHPVHSPVNMGFLASAGAEMRERGWRGQDLLVEESIFFGMRPEYFAWTGSDRLSAAKAAGLRTVPCRVLTSAAADRAFRAAGYRKWAFECWRDAVAWREGPGAKDYLRGLERAGLREAAEMVRAELAAASSDSETPGTPPPQERRGSTRK